MYSAHVALRLFAKPDMLAPPERFFVIESKIVLGSSLYLNLLINYTENQKKFSSTKNISELYIGLPLIALLVNILYLVFALRHLHTIRSEVVPKTKNHNFPQSIKQQLIISIKLNPYL